MTICVFDIDGSLANIEHRRHLVQCDNPDWPSFNYSMFLDTPNDAVIDLYKAIQATKKYDMAIFTGRSSEFRDVTIEWLDRNGITFDHFMMRDRYSEASVSDVVVKNRMVEDLQSSTGKIISFAVDDRPCVCRDVWIARGIFLFDVGQKCEDF